MYLRGAFVGSTMAKYKGVQKVLSGRRVTVPREFAEVGDAVGVEYDGDEVKMHRVTISKAWNPLRIDKDKVRGSE